MNRYIVIFMVLVGLLGGSYQFGRCQAFEDIIGEKCWLDKVSRDVNCISYIAR